MQPMLVLTFTARAQLLHTGCQKGAQESLRRSMSQGVYATDTYLQGGVCHELVA